ncbi:hypothetical protein P168DRAFT_324609 [Aspergillus campestris IBT 28561]|uniref:Uncharacterized protein n=1 Tax=Aspergillus campestris (strain IBT 28561) TaxID=1392248 RepID=A0A2I1DBD4_ASPC2|nr:uncharacterized protein P168DRAFT_324609 [Aspergillus campestris IBT 28561]PKY07173.1 hypothetical protein P168DRAFT_324609 [Aspergillus campestris IBT 28561]
MLQERLNDAAIALNYHLTQNQTPHGIFGGYAITVLGKTRETDNIDCLASITKHECITLLNGKSGFVAKPRPRQDWIQFEWSEESGEPGSPIRVKIICEMFGGAKYNMSGVQPISRSVEGRYFRKGPCCLLDPFLIFKGKVCVAASRSKSRDFEDIQWLADRYGPVIRERWREIKPRYIGFAMRRHPELEHLFGQLQVDISEAKAFVHGVPTPSAVTEPAVGEAHEGLLG